jgi:hypothetical protein
VTVDVEVSLQIVRMFLILLFGIVTGWGLMRVLMGYMTGFLPLMVGAAVLILLVAV